MIAQSSDAPPDSPFFRVLYYLYSHFGEARGASKGGEEHSNENL